MRSQASDFKSQNMEDRTLKASRTRTEDPGKLRTAAEMVSSPPLLAEVTADAAARRSWAASERRKVDGSTT